MLRVRVCVGRLENCSRAMSVRCPAANEDSLKRHNCNADGECEDISGVFSCKRGHCANLSEIYNCRPQVSGSFNIEAEKVRQLGFVMSGVIYRSLEHHNN